MTHKRSTALERSVKYFTGGLKPVKRYTNLTLSNMNLYKLQKLHSLMFYIELSSKFEGVGLKLALLKDN